MAIFFFYICYAIKIVFEQINYLKHLLSQFELKFLYLHMKKYSSSVFVYIGSSNTVFLVYDIRMMLFLI